VVSGRCPFATFIGGVQTFAPGYADRVGFCDHTAAGYMRTMKDPGFWNVAGVSAHFAISKTGEIVQLVDLFDTAFAQGRLGPRVAWAPFEVMGRGNPNGYLISIEHEDETELHMA
jgi:N-acetyl-anhydromuramyl-L-alanine amidase AmpD